MLRTWDQRRAQGADWLGDAQESAAPEDPLSAWLERVDLLLYAAMAGFLACLTVILVA